MDEKILIRSARQGNVPAFEKLINLYQKKFYNYALRLTHDSHQAQDLCQEAFIKAFHGILTFKGNSSFSTWIYRIVHNTFFDFYRKEKGEGSQNTTDLDENLPEQKETNIRLFYERIRQTERTEWLQKGLIGLSPVFRSLIILRDIQGFSYEEISEITNSSIGTVKSRLNRAREHLKAVLSSIDLKG